MSLQSKKALIIIDAQNDYFPEGKYPLWNTEATLANIESAIGKAQAKKIPVVLVQHVGDADSAKAPFFNEGSTGAELHARVKAIAPDAIVVRKAFADSFHETDLAEKLESLGTQELLIGGMMTQNCVTHTAVSRAAEPYKVSILTDCTTSVDPMVHMIALHGVSTRAALVDAASAI